MNRFHAGAFSVGVLLAAIVVLGPGGSSIAIPHGDALQARRAKPNFIVVLCDDLGYGDIQPYGGSIPTPAINRMAREGLVATDYYTPGNICTPSRAGLLTGRYPVRTGLGYEVILPNDDRVLPLSEKTIATALKPDYATGLFGKWHLGHKGDKWLPTNYGFDVFFGIPYSHDMLPLPVWDVDAKTGRATSQPADLAMLQQQFYTHAESFIESHRGEPFFVELALSAPHLPEHPQGEFKGSSKAGPYGDVVREIDSIVGRLLDRLKALHLDQDTIVILTSDNGPWYEGSAGPLRDRKGGASYDGGYRVPFVAWSPGRIKPGSKTGAIICGIDLMPTFCKMAGTGLPKSLEIDGRDISGVLTAGAASPHDAILLFNNEDVVAIRTPEWKYATQVYYRGFSRNLEKEDWLDLFDMTGGDVSESYSVAANHPDVVRDMQSRLKQARETFAPFRRGMPPSLLKVFEQMRQQGQHQD
jgi:arylsulfatase A-like enzyme